ncbi:molecular chaperone [Halorussus sp. MSC15.2]|uniref:TorD/DmsD family molecular chaperone n=1 Tax=Halorussus sp. MSC15.2 TaxID=2283638 RepID=UPI0013D7CA88|nr:molecular chaperone TorD family protein [Halorussus sp. MSC15.2]NEU56984.1 molecular chaperone TorD family protein [Halorussus sp. MSC15.2]
MDERQLYDARIELLNYAIDTFWDTPRESFVANLLEGEIRIPGDEVNPAMDEGFAQLERFVEANEGRSVEDVQDELATEFTRVFVGPRPPVLAHETYYREDEDFLGEGLAAVSASYAAAGWSPPEAYPEEDDHLAVELAFLRYLVDRQRAGDEETFGYERVFLDEHLLHWADAFAEDVLDETDEPFYRAGANVVAGLAEFEDELVAQMV